MDRKKDKNINLSYESDGKMGKDKKNKKNEQKINHHNLLHSKYNEEFFFTTTQNSE